MHDSKMTRMQLVNELKALREEIRLREERQRNSIVQSGIVASAKGIGPQSRLRGREERVIDFKRDMLLRCQ